MEKKELFRIPPAPIIPRIADSEKFISKRRPVQAMICEAAAGSIADKKICSLLAPVAYCVELVFTTIKKNYI